MSVEAEPTVGPAHEKRLMESALRHNLLAFGAICGEAFYCSRTKDLIHALGETAIRTLAPLSWAPFIAARRSNKRGWQRPPVATSAFGFAHCPQRVAMQNSA